LITAYTQFWAGIHQKRRINAIKAGFKLRLNEEYLLSLDLSMVIFTSTGIDTVKTLIVNFEYRILVELGSFYDYINVHVD
jgi:hypothetical protein